MKIVGSCTCPVGSAAGHDADECRANLLEDGSILCVICSCRYPKMSQPMQRIWRAICESGYKTPMVELGSATKPGTSAYDASCLSGYDPALSERVYAVFAAGAEKVVLSYEQNDEPELANPDRSLDRELTAGEAACLPARVKDCVERLKSLGFCLRHFGDELHMRIVMTCGRPVGSMGYVLGATVELIWD